MQIQRTLGLICCVVILVIGCGCRNSGNQDYHEVIKVKCCYLYFDRHNTTWPGLNEHCEYYDSLHHILKRESARYVTWYTYNDKGLITSETLPRGEFKVRIYDDNNNLVRVERRRHRDSSGYIMREYAYDHNNYLVKEKWAESGLTSDVRYAMNKEYSYRDSLIDSTIEYRNDKIEATSQYTYDNSGRLSHIDRLKGRVKRHEYFEYDADGNIIEHGMTKLPNPDDIARMIGAPDYFRRTYAFDDEGRKIEEVRFQPNGGLAKVAVYEYEVVSKE